MHFLKDAPPCPTAEMSDARNRRSPHRRGAASLHAGHARRRLLCFRRGSPDGLPVLPGPRGGAPADTLVELLRSAHALPTVSADTPAPSVATGTMLWSPTDLSATAAPAELAGHARYRLLRQLGAGGMGAVWLAEHSVMGRQVALKVIRPEHLARPGAAERFRREVHAAACLHHPNIVTAYDADQAGTTHFLVMEYVEGVSLAEHLERTGPLPVAEACRLARRRAGLATRPRTWADSPRRQAAQPHADRRRRREDPRLRPGRAGRRDRRRPRASPGPTWWSARRITSPRNRPRTPTPPTSAPTSTASAARSTTCWPAACRSPATRRCASSTPTAPSPPAPIRSLRLDVPTELAIVLAKMMAKDPAQRVPDAGRGRRGAGAVHGPRRRPAAPPLAARRRRSRAVRRPGRGRRRRLPRGN